MLELDLFATARIFPPLILPPRGDSPLLQTMTKIALTGIPVNLSL